MKSAFYRLLGCFVMGLFITGCIPETEVVYEGVSFDLNDPQYQHIYDLQVRQEVDSLLALTSHPDPTRRFMVARAFSSIQDETALDSLYKLLQDEEKIIGSTAAYAIGQIGNPSSVRPLMSAFKSSDTSRVYNLLNANILEALGKTADTTVMNSIATVSSYTPSDTTLLKGQARGIYQAILRDLHSKKIDEAILKNLTQEDLPVSVRTIYAQALERSKDIDISGYEQRLFRLFDEGKSPYISMALAETVSKIQDPKIKQAFVEKLNDDIDYRTKINMIKSLGNLPYIQVIEPILELLKDDNLNIANTAADYMIENGIASDAIIYKNFIPKDAPYSVKNKIKAAIFKRLPNYYTRTKNALKKDMLTEFNDSKDPYEQRSIINALGYDLNNIKELGDMYADSLSPILKSEIVSSLMKIATSENFLRQRKSALNAQKQLLANELNDIIADGDVGALALAANIYQNEELNLKSVMPDASKLNSAVEKLKLPQDLETYNELKKAIAFLENSSYEPGSSPNVKAISWSLMPNMNDSLHALMKTTSGNIKIKLFPKLAPQSVFNFVQLANSEFFDNKAVHRVVPNFVVQDGCPRGDGYGSLDYSIRSELPQQYYEDEGYLGMASAGLHTECSQWFITHRPTMHLNGRYTIFGKVTDGMDVIHQMTVGDTIIDISIIN